MRIVCVCVRARVCMAGSYSASRESKNLWKIPRKAIFQCTSAVINIQHYFKDADFLIKTAISWIRICTLHVDLFRQIQKTQFYVFSAKSP